jgi:hypothetical protein
MSATLTIPADVVPAVREGLFCLLGDATETMTDLLEQGGGGLSATVFAAARAQLACVFELLDLVGWAPTDGRREIQVDLAEQGPAVKEALDSYLPVLEDQEAEVDVDDRRRAREGKPPRKREILERLLACREFAELLERRLIELG